MREMLKGYLTYESYTFTTCAHKQGTDMVISQEKLSMLYSNSTFQEKY